MLRSNRVHLGKLINKMTNSRIIAGRHTRGLDQITITGVSDGKLRIGSFCSVAANCTVYLGGGHDYEFGSNFGFHTLDWADHDTSMKMSRERPKRDVIVGNDAWIGFGVTLMAGVEIGDGAVVAANSHVVKNVPPYAIVGGNPAKLIKMRFPENVVERLLHLKWWDLPDEAVKRLAPLLSSPRIYELLIALEDPLLTFRERHLRFASQDDAEADASKTRFRACLEDHGIVIMQKRGVVLLAEVGIHASWWRDFYPTWEDASHAVYDSLLTESGTFIDIGAWNGCTAAYAAQKCRRVVSVEADPHAASDFLVNTRLNCRNVQLVQKAICAEGRAETILFGRNEALRTGWNQSTSQARTSGGAVFNDDLVVPTTTLNAVLALAQGPVDLIKVDIEGGEEDLIPELMALRGISILLSVHYDWWKEKDLTRFAIPEDLREAIRNAPFGTFLVFDGALRHNLQD